MKNIQKDITDFMLLAKQEVPVSPIVPSIATRKLRAKLILEEALEQCHALGIIIRSQYGDIEVLESNVLFEESGSHQPNLVEIADGCCDQVYVSVGTAIACGINLEPIWKLVQESNMAKFGPGSYRRDDGKQMKPPGWVPPTQDIKNELSNQELPY